MDGATTNSIPVNGEHRETTQVPMAVVSMACRLPENCHNTHELWKFLNAGKVARIDTPPTRFSQKTHYDGITRQQTMASPGGMFLQDVDIRDLDAKFFRLSGLEAKSMDPQQRLLLEVVYEGLENGGVSMERIDGAPVGCFVASFWSDYADMQARDPENNCPNNIVGTGRAMMSNRLSHFLNIRGPSITVDTACSGSLHCIDLAARYLQTREISAAIVAGSNIYCHPEHTMERVAAGENGAASNSGRCHTFDAKADGYIKAEGVNMVFLKRLDDAIRDKDPIRAIIRGSAVNSDGWTTGISSPNHEAQAVAVRQAYKNAGITDLSLTNYVEFHGTGTKVGDGIEATAVASVFGEYQTPDKPLRVGSVKSNIGHSEPSAGLSGLIKTILSLEHGVIPGNPTFIDPNPKIDFKSLRILPFRTAIPWPTGIIRRASINSFGFGGANAHVVVDEANGLSRNHVSSFLDDDDDDLFQDDELAKRPYLLVLSANDPESLDKQLSALDRHLSNPSVRVRLRDLAYTLSDRRTRHFHRGYIVSDCAELDLHRFVHRSVRPEPPKVGFIFTGQGAQWSQMGKSLVETFPQAEHTINYLDSVLQNSHDPPAWKLCDELVSARSAEHMRLPEISQPLVTALQLALLAVLEASGVTPRVVVGHSSGEIAAAVASGHLTPTQGIQIAYYRGKAAAEAVYDKPVGMMAVGLGPDRVATYLQGSSIEIACFNSPESVTLSGVKSELVEMERTIKEDGHFARMLLVNAAYHSRHMKSVASKYQALLEQHVSWGQGPRPYAEMFSSTTGKKVMGHLDAKYWVKNMVSPVLFGQALSETLAQESNEVDFLIEIGPSNALSGPVKQTQQAISSKAEYAPAWKRGAEAVQTMLELGGKLFNAGYPIKLAPLNDDDEPDSPAFVADLPNYSWNHSTKHWHESESSSDWRFRRFLHHDLLGSKILGTPWTHPIFKNTFRLDEITWLRDHMINGVAMFPAVGFIAMAIEAIFQKSVANGEISEETAINHVTYQLRNISFQDMLSLEHEDGVKLLLSLKPSSSSTKWHEFTISSIPNDGQMHPVHCHGLVGIGDNVKKVATLADVAPLQHPDPGILWHKAMNKVGFIFGPSFQNLEAVESEAGGTSCRALIKATAPPSRFRHSRYPVHPTVIDSCLQLAGPPLSYGLPSAVKSLATPSMIDELYIFSQSGGVEDRVMAATSAEWSGVGRSNDKKRWVVHGHVFSSVEPDSDMILQLKGLRLSATGERNANPHTFGKAVWSEDVDFLTSSQMADVLRRASVDFDEDVCLKRVAKLVSLIAHKNPFAKLLEVEADEGPSSGQSLWLDFLRQRSGQIAEGLEYHLSSLSGNASLNARERYKAETNVEFRAHERATLFGDKSDTEDHTKFDIIIVKSAHHTVDLGRIMEGAQKALARNGYLVVIEDEREVYSNGTNGELPEEKTSYQDFETVPGVVTTDIPRLAYVGSVKGGKDAVTSSLTRNEIHVLPFYPPDGSTDTIKESLVGHGWQITEHSIPPTNIPTQSTVLVLDELFTPVLSRLGDDQFVALRELLDRQCRLLWVTKGSQMKVTNPELGLFPGLARSFLAEYPTNLVLSLDVESNDNPNSLEAIHTALKHLNSVDNFTFTDNEFVERNGIVHISRAVADQDTIRTEKDYLEGPELCEDIVYGHPSTIRLITKRSGTWENLTYAESTESSLKSDDVEVEVHSMGLNDEDVANALGLVPGNEHLFGVECSGVVRQVGHDVTSIKPGDRVLVLKRSGGCLANRVRSHWQTVHVLPDWMSFDDGISMGIGSHTAMHALVDLAEVQKGKTVLIHSATGSTGLAAVGLCQYLGAEIYATVETNERRQYLEKNYDVPDDHIFSSRSTLFANAIMKATKERGVDVCLNSLQGDMLHESWRCIAENGTFIDLSKKDRLDRNSLSMEPFTRNATYRACDLYRSSVTDDWIRRIGVRVFDMIINNRIQPLPICKVFPVEETVEAFRYMQRGEHIGKVLISYEYSKEAKIPFRPAIQNLHLRPDGAYLIAGGFKGLCGSLAIYLAQNGARTIVVMSRSGYEDPSSKAVIHNCNALGCHVDLVRGDVTSLDDVKRAFKSASKPVVGVIQGAMVLRDRMFSSMTPQEFREPIAPKVVGTWNLHTAAQENKCSLDFFTMLSSVSGLSGALGQANYAAGNVFLDAFAAYRQQQGLPACSIDLGPIEEVGYLAEHEDVGRRLEARGWCPIDEPLLHRILRASILQQTRINPDRSVQLITGIPIPILSSEGPVELTRQFSSLRPAAGTAVGTESEAKSTMAARLGIMKKASKGGIDKPTLIAVAIELIGGVLKRSLGTSESLEASRPLTNYGIDSLVVVELRNWVRSELGMELTQSDIREANTLASLSETVVKKLLQ